MIPIGWIVIAAFIGVNAYAAKTKNKKLMFSAIAALGIIMFALAPIRTMSEQGKYIVIENKFGGKATLEKVNSSKSFVYVMVGQVERPFGMSGYSMKIPVLPIGTVDELNQKYGDFRKCDTPNKAAMISQIVELRLVDADKNIISQIEKAFEYSIGNYQDIIIRVDATPLQLIENKMAGRGGDRSPANQRENLWVKNLSFFPKSVK